MTQQCKKATGIYTKEDLLAHASSGRFQKSLHAEKLDDWIQVGLLGNAQEQTRPVARTGQVHDQVVAAPAVFGRVIRTHPQIKCACLLGQWLSFVIDSNRCNWICS